MEASLRTRSCRCTREDERKHRLIARRLSPACAQTLSSVVDRGSDQVRFMTIGVFEPRAALPVLGLDPREVTRLLRYCPPDGIIHLSQVLTAMTALTGYKNAQRPLIFLRQRGPVTFEEVLGWVKSVLNAMRLSCRVEGNTVPDRESLAQGLAKLIFG